MKEYAGNDGVVVEWRPDLCYHSRNCVRALPLVFDPDRRPWIDAAAASADEVRAAVAGCPSGALRIKAEQRQAVVEVGPSANGPLLVRGPIKIVDADGNVVQELEKAAFCRCGGSQNKPFCDGTHKTIGFVA
ncbi:MAG TPA: (4Fe-4S)-binding protein [Gaiellaceae bacterium]